VLVGRFGGSVAGRRKSDGTYIYKIIELKTDVHIEAYVLDYWGSV
jgi:hypothetical protein